MRSCPAIPQRIAITKALCEGCAHRRGYDGPSGRPVSIVLCGAGRADRTHAAVSLCAGVCPDGHWDARSLTALPAVLSTPLSQSPSVGDPAAVTQRQRKTLWKAVRDTWAAGESFARSMASAGFTGRRVNPRTFALRVLSCHGDGAGKPPCRHRAYSVKGQFHYCNLCGCGEREMAALDSPPAEPGKPNVDFNGPYTKLHYPYLRCPVSAPGFSNGGTDARVGDTTG